MCLKIGNFIGKFSLLIALLSFIPSMAFFTPALLFSCWSVLGGLIGALSGYWRTAVMTWYIALATLLISPVFYEIGTLMDFRLLLLMLLVLGLGLLVGLCIDYRKCKVNLDE